MPITYTRTHDDSEFVKFVECDFSYAARQVVPYCVQANAAGVFVECDLLAQDGE